MKVTNEQVLYDNLTEKNDQIEFQINDETVKKILHEKMYTNPTESVVREILSNALDASVEAGTDKPVEIDLNKERLIIRDYGNGISPEKARNIYTVYGTSDKTTTNKLLGGYGLGSKSPFAITDTFQINTYCNGILYKYCAISGKKTILTKISEEKKEIKPFGTEIIIPVKSESYYYELRRYVIHYTKFIPNKVKVIQPEITFPKILYEDENFIFPQEWSSGFLVNNTIFYSWFMKENIVYKVPIEKVKLTPTRENILNADELKNECYNLLEKTRENFPLHIQFCLDSKKKPEIKIKRVNWSDTRNEVNISERLLTKDDFEYNIFKIKENEKISSKKVYTLYKEGKLPIILIAEDKAKHENFPMFSDIPETEVPKKEKTNTVQGKGRLIHLKNMITGETIEIRTKEIEDKFIVTRSTYPSYLKKLVKLGIVKKPVVYIKNYKSEYFSKCRKYEEILEENKELIEKAKLKAIFERFDIFLTKHPDYKFFKEFPVEAAGYTEYDNLIEKELKENFGVIFKFYTKSYRLEDEEIEEIKNYIKYIEETKEIRFTSVLEKLEKDLKERN